MKNKWKALGRFVIKDKRIRYTDVYLQYGESENDQNPVVGSAVVYRTDENRKIMKTNGLFVQVELDNRLSDTIKELEHIIKRDALYVQEGSRVMIKNRHNWSCDKKERLVKLEDRPLCSLDIKPVFNDNKKHKLKEFKALCYA
jgi:hypothetical protein